MGEVEQLKAWNCALHRQHAIQLWALGRKSGVAGHGRSVEEASGNGVPPTQAADLPSSRGSQSLRRHASTASQTPLRCEADPCIGAGA